MTATAKGKQIFKLIEAFSQLHDLHLRKAIVAIVQHAAASEFLVRRARKRPHARKESS
jgi:hypothetical protein